LTVYVYSDASFKRPHAGVAAVIVDVDSHVVVSRWCKCRGNNEAEYIAALFGAEMASSWFPTKQIIVITDSELLYKQFHEKVKTRSRTLIALRGRLGAIAIDVKFDPKHPLVKSADRFARTALAEGRKHAS
jgi:ribonuclease HI